MKKTNKDSLLETALEIMKEKDRPQPMNMIVKEVFKKRKISLKEEDIKAQFQLDFMYCGLFVYCGEEEKSKFQLWDLKNRQPTSLLDKDAGVIDDIYENDQEVLRNELQGEIDYKNIGALVDDELVEEDEIAAEVNEGPLRDDEDTDFSDLIEREASFEDEDEDLIEEEDEEEDEIAAEVAKITKEQS